jgi:CubicO group peptidase (beta-lactamase class C family)
MRWTNLLGALALVATALPAAAQVAVTADSVPKLQQMGAEVLFWTQAQRDANFPHMETLFPGHVVHAGPHPHVLLRGRPLPLAEGAIDAFMDGQNVAGLIVLQDGQVRLERYKRGYSGFGRWTSFSVAKLITSTLLGAAILDGYIKSVKDPVTRYLPELAGSAYDGVSIAQLLTMTSGVKWNEDYTDPKSDVAQMLAQPVPAGTDPTVAYLRSLPREAKPGEKWVYKTGETNLVGVLVARVTHRTLADYLTRKVWKKYGMERDAFWMSDASGQDVGGCCLSVSLRDYARFGQLVLDGGAGVVPDGWFDDATRPRVPFGNGSGYGYQWWTYPEGRFGAVGIFGQSILVDPKHHIVIAMSGAWPKATDPALSAQRAAFQAKLIEASLK